MSSSLRWLRRQRRRLISLGLILLFGLVGWLVSVGLFGTIVVAKATSPILAAAPRQPLGSYDYFGRVLSASEAAALVQQKGLNSSDPKSYLKIGAIKITQDFLDVGEKIFLNRKLGDTFGLQRVFGFQVGFAQILPELAIAIATQHGKPTSNLVVTLTQDLRLGSKVFPKGTKFPTGLDLARGSVLPIGVKLPGDITCALCHVAIGSDGKQMKGVPNGDLAIPLLVALAPNSAAGFARLDLKFLNPLDKKFNGSGKTIIDSKGQLVKLPDPDKFEQAFDDLVLAVPFGHFESSPDGIDNTTQIPPLFTFKSGPYTAGGEFAVGPFAGLASVTNGVHSSEINLLAAAQQSAASIGIDREVYLGTVLQNAADPKLRIPDLDPDTGKNVKPSEWLRKKAPNLAQAELEDQVAAPGLGSYPNLKISTLTYNGLVFSPDTNDQRDLAKGTFFFANNAMSAWQNSLVPPPNRSDANRDALKSGSVDRGAALFESSCITCHHAPFFTDNKIHGIAEIKTNPARGQSRLNQNALLVAPKIYSFDNSVPIPANATVLEVPTAGISDAPNLLPKGLLPDGGYKTPSLRGLYLTAPYLHDGGVAVRKGAILLDDKGNYTVADRTGLGLPGTLSQGILPDAAASLRALIDRSLRTQVIANNRSSQALQVSNLDGSGHEFYIKGAKNQQDMVNFLLALDDDPAKY
jgi:cytochrome c5